ncbi:caspase family protein [Catenuloplanes japonicus]|uniref:caspase family protein n=1 Tax=Catenuloplanes japonicus TaxID=33876 RepID=UPI00052740C5|nr:caspase family protein [Catenuloplanes japonicus]
MARSALLVVTDDYSDAVNGLGPLRSPVSDALMVQDLLQMPYTRFDSIDLMVNEPLTKVRREIERFLRGSRRDDVLLYFSGHGARFADEYFYALTDTERQFLKATGLSESFLKWAIEYYKTRSKTVILDTCRSGLRFAKGGANPEGEPAEPGFSRLAGDGISIISASSATERTFERPDPGGNGTYYSIFTSALAYAIREGIPVDQEGVVRAGPLVDFTRFLLDEYAQIFPDMTSSTPEHSILQERQGGVPLAYLGLREEGFVPAGPCASTLFDRLREVEKWPGDDVIAHFRTRQQPSPVAIPAPELAPVEPLKMEKLNSLSPERKLNRVRGAEEWSGLRAVIQAGVADAKENRAGIVHIFRSTFVRNAAARLRYSDDELQEQINAALEVGLIRQDGPKLIIRIAM